jgi:acetylornithine deacetylase/succinyl-diaminopimelate desuccinylase-like protein
MLLPPRFLVLASLLVSLVGVFVVSASQSRAQPNPQAGRISALLADPAVKLALEATERNEPWVLDEQRAICEVPAPPFKERERAALYKGKFEEAGLTDVRFDPLGNVIGERRGQNARPNVVISAHLDTVFPEGTDVRTSRQGNILKGPGIGDDCRGLAVVLGIIRALNEAHVMTRGTVTFVGTLGEEGLGDLRGVKHLFSESMKGRIDRFVSIDGSGFGITNVAVGSLRYRVTYKGPGGHSYGSFGIANPAHALGRALATVAELKVPSRPKTTFSVGRVGGGTSVNAIPSEIWFEMDMRSSDPAALRALDGQFKRAVNEALGKENARWNGQGRLTVDLALVGDRPAGGGVAADSPIVQTAVAVTEALNLPVSLDEGSTDANFPMSLGIPSITIDAGGRGQGAHALEETFDATGSWRGTQRATLLTIALAQDP